VAHLLDKLNARDRIHLVLIALGHAAGHLTDTPPDG
jgi:hypothetical protein